MLHVPLADDMNGTLVVPGVPTIDICVLPSNGAGIGITNCPTDFISNGPAGGSVTVPEMRRS